ncbi:MAG: DUF2088 domain-containing protein [Planctomycetales bacterium]|nr:DUF2088 domain-containing protein [Planctomycetales bacterium]
MADAPRLFRVRQHFQTEQVDDIEAEVESQLRQLNLAEKIQPGQSVAVTAGSRGIANIAKIVRGCVQHLRQLGAEPFLVPAMGSHGGGTADGQRKIVESYGMTEEFCGCPIRASMETVVVCDAAEGFPVHFDKHAYGADHVMVVGRVKPHTNFRGDIESGLMKMMLIGLGKHEGAKIYHKAIRDYEFGQIVRSVAREVLAKCGIVAGVAIVENAYDKTARIEAVRPEEFESREKELLRLAKQWMPRTPFDRADLLWIDEMGKDVSGSGMDTNVVGRKYNDHVAADHETPKVHLIAVRGLTEATHGNATGLGMAEFCLSRVIRAVDSRMTRINCLTGGHVTAAMSPLDYETDEEIWEAASWLFGLKRPVDADIMWIHNTLDLAEVECSESYWDEARQRDDLEVVVPLRPMPWVDGLLPSQRSLSPVCAK